VPGNPFQGLPIAAGAEARDRVLSDAEVGAVWRAAGAMGWPFGPLVRLLLLTAQRRDEVAALRWSELSPDLAVWTVPKERAKNGRAHLVHLAPEARAVLAAVPRVGGPRPGVHHQRPHAGVGLRQGQGALDRLSGVRDWRLHDCRRTAVTWMAGAGFPPHVADRLLNHVEGAIRGRGGGLPARRVPARAQGRARGLGRARADCPGATGGFQRPTESPSSGALLPLRMAHRSRPIRD
jgi:integrase